MTASCGVEPSRVNRLNTAPDRPGPVVYWMSRDQRVRDKPTLLFAGELANRDRAPLVVAFCLVQRFLGAGPR